jgi:AcrR family transcriptional regulator
MINQQPGTRERLIDAAMQLFAAKGYGSTSIADVLHEGGVNSGSLYYFFPGKQDLLLAVLEAYRSGIGPMLIAPAWDGVADPVERIFALLARYRHALVASDCAYGCPIGSLALELHEPDPAVRAALAANFAAWTEAIEGCLAAAGHALPKGTDRRALAEFVLTTMEGAVMQSRTQRDIAFFDRSVSQLRTHFSLLLNARKQARRSPRRTS